MSSCIILLLFSVKSRFICIAVLLGLFFFKQKTAYEMRISDWSSDVCSSDLPRDAGCLCSRPHPLHLHAWAECSGPLHRAQIPGAVRKIGRASCRERVCQYV